MAQRRPEGGHGDPGPGTTKKGEGRTIYLTAALRTLLGRRRPRETLAKSREQITPRVFLRHGKPICSF
jgi:hypothetical protein